MPYIEKTDRLPYIELIKKIGNKVANIPEDVRTESLSICIVMLLSEIYNYSLINIGVSEATENIDINNKLYIKDLAALVPLDYKKRSGHMNYIISRLIAEVYGMQLRYYQWNDIIGILKVVSDSLINVNLKTKIQIKGMLNCAAMEINRKYVIPYEDTKINDPKCGDLLEI